MASGLEPLEEATAATVDETVRRLAIDLSHDLIALLDPAGMVVWASPSYRLIGYEPEELSGTQTLDLIHPDDLPVATAGLATVSGGGDVEAVTVRLRRADGGWIWIEARGVPVYGADGSLRFLLGTAKDVTEREELRSRLRDLDAVYRFADAVKDAGDLETVLQTALDALLEATAADRASVLLADDAGVFRFRAWRGLSDSYRAATEGHSPWAPDAIDPQPVLVPDVASAGFEPKLEKVVRREGIGALAFVPLVHGDRALGKFMLYRDEPHEWTEREVQLTRAIASHLASVTVRMRFQQRLKESSDELATILRTVGAAITVQKPDGSIVYANDAAAHAMGYESVDALLAVASRTRPDLFELADESGLPLPLEEMPTSLALRGTGAARVVRGRNKKTGEERWYAIRANPVLGRDGEPALAIAVTHDVTHEKLADQEQRAGRERLELLLDATEQLTETFDLEETLRRVPHIVVPRLGEACHVYLANEDGSALTRVAYTHADPELERDLASLPAELDRRRFAKTPIMKAFTSGAVQHIPAVRDPLRLGWPEGSEALARLDTRSVITLPLQARGRRFGAIALNSTTPGRFGEAELELATELARRISLALDSVALHRSAQDALARLQAVLAQLPLGVAIADADGRLVMRNDAVEEMWGVPVAVGRPLEEYASMQHWRPDGAAIPWTEWAIERSLRGEHVVGERQDFRHLDGSRRTMEVSATPVRDEQGAIVAAVSIMGDVTDRRRGEERLRFLAAAGEALAGSLDTDETLRRVAELAVPSLAGYLVIDLLDDASGELRCVASAHADPPRAELVRSMREQYPPLVPTHPVQVALRTGEPVLIEDLQDEVDAMAQDARHAKAIREIANTSGIVVPLIARGRTLGTISLGTVEPAPRFEAEDVEVAVELARRASLALDNARLYREAQERAHAAEALEFVGDGVFLLDGAGMVRLWNPAAEACFRIPAAEALGRPVAELIPDWAAISAQVPVAAEPLASGTRARSLPVEAGGEERWLSLSAVRFPGGTVYAFRDETEARAIEQMKTDFVSTVSHELRTPLAAIYGAALTLRREDVVLEEAQQAGLLDVIAGEADRLARIVNDILWASRLESAGLEVEIKSCDARAIAEQVVEVQRARLPEGLRVEVSGGESVPPVAADPDKLRQVLTNLLDNAVKYSPEGGLIELEVTRTGRRIRFRVGDEGLGVPPAEQDRIFEKFFRLDPNLARGVGGTGLGLYITRELVSRMEGRIWVVSDGRRGSSFFVELPAA
ncbi:MAG: PAS domain S-box protein [Actinobacteria bacterium]|nr:PAS domain S-box protein [Actinomycetota bacterium]